MRVWMPSVSPVPLPAMSSSSVSSSSARQRTTCSTGPNTSSCRSLARSSAIIVGGTKRPRGGSARPSSQRKITRPCPALSAIQRSSRCLASSSITGPTWVAGSRGSPSESSFAAPAIISIMRSATSSCTQRSRSAEQRCPAERNADVTTSSVTCSGSAVASTIMALMPPVSAISGTIGPSLAASARLMAWPDFGRAGEGNAGDARIGHQRRARLCRRPARDAARSPARRPGAADARLRRQSAASARRALPPRHCRRRAPR